MNSFFAFFSNDVKIKRACKKKTMKYVRIFVLSTFMSDSVHKINDLPTYDIISWVIRVKFN